MQAAGAQGREERRGARGSRVQAGEQGAGSARAGRAGVGAAGTWGAGRECAGHAAWARGAHGLGVPVRGGWACWLGQLGQLGALCTWLSFDPVFNRFDSVLFWSHEMNTVHYKKKI